MKKISFFLFFLLALVSCQRLDQNLYNLEAITEYKLDDFDGEQDFILDASYEIPDSLILKFSVNSQTPDESAPTRIEAIYIGDVNQIATDTVILYCHGNYQHMDFYWQRAKLLAHTGGKMRYGVLMFDYRGYGLSQGTPSEAGMYADADACMQWLRDRGLTSERLVVYGFSLGSAPATELSAHPRSLRPAWLMLEAPFASASALVTDGSQLNLPASYFTNLEIDNAEEIKAVQQPFFIIHGTADQSHNIETHGKLILQHYQGVYSESHWIEGAGHSSVPQTTGFAEYNHIMHEFISQH
jgi:pimeloyl-ACP methyl ester carboxylesterase